MSLFHWPFLTYQVSHWSTCQSWAGYKVNIPFGPQNTLTFHLGRRNATTVATTSLGRCIVFYNAMQKQQAATGVPTQITRALPRDNPRIAAGRELQRPCSLSTHPLAFHSFIPSAGSRLQRPWQWNPLGRWLLLPPFCTFSSLCTFGT